MTFTLRPAVRENVPLLIGLAGGTGSGKTYSAMRIAKGLAGGKPFAVIDTESGRAKAYADEFQFDHGELIAPFTPESYAQAILAVDALHKYPVIVVDSASHEYAGDGGVLDMQEEELERMAGSDFNKRESCKMASWVKPKLAHKAYMTRLLQIRAHLILCFRAEPKTEMVKEGGKWQVQLKKGLTGLDGWFPICEKNMPYELTDYFLLQADRPGVPHPIKLMDKHKAFFPLTSPITEEAGVQLAAWAKGSNGSAVAHGARGGGVEDKGSLGAAHAAETSEGERVISQSQYDDLFAYANETPERMQRMRAKAKSLGYSKFAHTKVKDLQAILDAGKESA